ncbi:MAG: apolipoprotein acyltransferase [Bryobacteraceae bacterium]|nr:apolipoprotein acyltransferase [Bryobacteraceae bacterium]
MSALAEFKKTSPTTSRNTGRLWLTGTVLSLFAIHSNWDIPLTAWLYPIFLLRYGRLTPAGRGIPRVGAAVMIAIFFWLAVTSMLFVPVALAAFVFLGILLTVPFALDRLLAPRLGGLAATLVFPASRVAMEYVFVCVAGFGSWGSLGVTQHNNLLLIQTASITGVYGVSFLIAWFASLANWAWASGFKWGAIKREVLIYAGVLALVLGGGAVRLLFFRPVTHTLRVAGVGPSRATEAASLEALGVVVKEYWRPERVAGGDPVLVRKAFLPINDELIARTEREARSGAKIVLWPETQARVLEQDFDAFVDRIKRVARNENIYVNVAFALYMHHKPNIRNVAALITPQGEVAWTYDKTHPTPMELMKPGPGVVPVTDSPYGRLANVICYDADYPELMRAAANSRADLMLVPADDWEGFESLHAENVVFRAVENGYSVLRQASHGVSTAVDGQGRILKSVNYFTAADPTTIAQIPLQARTPTLYSMVGDLFAWLCIAGTILLVGKSLSLQHRA